MIEIYTIIGVLFFVMICSPQTESRYTSSTLHLSTAELGYSLGSLGNGVLGKLTRKHKTNSGLDLPGGKSGLLVVGGKLSSLGGDTLKDIVDEGVHDGHTLLGDSGIGVNLLKDLVDVRRVGLYALLALLGSGNSLLGCLGRFLGGGLGHVE